MIFTKTEENKKVEVTSEAISLFSVDQIREEESPWKALVKIASADRSARRASPFKKRLQELKKVRMLYGNLQRRALNRYLKEINRPEDLFLALESRLDIVLKRSALFPSVQSARKSILQGGISVNTTIVRSPRYHCTPGDCIQIVQKRIPQTWLYARQASLDENIKYKQTKQKKTHLICTKFQELFAFSELLQLFHRKTGRLHGSAFSDLENVNSLVLRNKGEREKVLLYPALLGTLKNALSKENRDYLHSSQEDPRTNRYKQISERVSHTGTHSITADNSEFEQLYAKRSFAQPSKYIASRPLHLEVSYRNLCVIFLYPPQRVCVDVSIDLSLLS